MFGAKRNYVRYLEMISPWVSGDWSEANMNTDEYRTQHASETYVIFPIPERELPGWFESLLLGDEMTKNALYLQSWVTRTNELIAIYNFTPTQRIERSRMLHRSVRTLKDVHSDLMRWYGPKRGNS